MGQLLEIRDADDHTAVVRFKFESMMERREIEQIYTEICDHVDKHKINQLVLDFKHVKYLSSQAIGIIMAFHNKLKREAGRLLLCSVGEPVMKLLVLVKLDRVLKIEPSLKEALRSLLDGA